MTDSQQCNHPRRPVIVQLNQLHGDEEAGEWRETIQWLDGEQCVEENSECKVQVVPSLDFQSLVDLQKFFEVGSVLLDVEENNLQKIGIRVAEQV